LGELCPGYNSLRTNAIHLVANKFATAVLLPKDEFKENIYGTGFDVIELSKVYSKSCAQVVLRMGEVLEGSIFLYSGLYEEGVEVGNWTLRYRLLVPTIMILRQMSMAQRDFSRGKESLWYRDLLSKSNKREKAMHGPENNASSRQRG